MSRVFPFIAMLIASVVVLSGCVGQTAQSPEAIVRAASAKMANVSEYNISYDVSSSIIAAGNSLDMDGTIVMAKKEASSLTRYRISAAGQQATSFDLYTLPNGTWQCSSLLGVYSCNQVSEAESSVQTPMEQSQALEEAIANKTVTLRSGQSRTLLGKSCAGVIADYDVAKLAEQMGLGAEGANVESLSVDICYETETGIPLYMSMSMKMSAEGESATMDMGMTATAVSSSSGEIALPAQA